MIIDANSVPRDTCLRADVCVVGSGAAGISLALALSDRGISVLLLESGYAHEDRRTQALYDGEVADEQLHSPPDKYRQRRFGGSTLIWGGRCVPFDPIDFEAREFVQSQGWPIAYSDVAAFYPAANTLAEAGRCEYDADKVFGPSSKPLIEGFTSSVVRTNSLERFSCPTNFAVRYGKRLKNASSLKLITGANCTAIRLQPNAEQVQALDIATLSGNRFKVAGRMFVLAVGGLETARLLLASRDVSTAGVGNDYDVVGRYYMCHIAGNVGSLTIKGPAKLVRHGYEIAPDGVYCRRRLSIAPSEQRRLALSNMVARLHFSRITDPAHRSGVLSGLFLARNIISYEYGKRLQDGGAATFANYLKHLRNVLTDPIDTSAFLLHWLAKRSLAERKFPSVILRNRTNRFSLEIHAEQIAQASSRVTLANSDDELGVPRLRVDWRYSPGDIDSVRRSLALISAEFERLSIGRLGFDGDTLEQDLMRFGAYGGHHIGTARMGNDVRTSVVDANCQLHAVENLFIAGSAVFPTSSQANPTLTIIALSLRLAEHLRLRLGIDNPSWAVAGSGQ
jgi:choline dehydrogenase-like flavoprotein